MNGQRLGRALQRAMWVTAAASLMVIGGCGGGGGDSDGADGGSNEGPVAGADYFPLGIGDRWMYVDDDGNSTQVDVVGTEDVGGVAAIVVRSAEMEGPDDQLYVKSATGVTLLPGRWADAVTAALGPMQILRLPPVSGDHWVIADRTLTALEDLDLDGRAEDVVVRIEATVVGFETISTSAGSFQNAAHVRTVATYSTRLTSSGQQLSQTVTSDEWLAPHVGLVRSLLTVSDGSGTETYGRVVTAWRAGGRRSENIAPTLTSKSPAEGAMLTGSFQLIQLRFSEPMDTSVAPAAMLEWIGPDGAPVPVNAQWGPDARNVTLWHESELVSGRHSVRVKSGAVDWAGNPLAAETAWTFMVDSTGPVPTQMFPLPDAIEVPLDSVVTLTLDEDPDPATVNTSNVSLVNTTISQFVDTELTLEGRKITLRPLQPLQLGARYQVNVIGVKDAHGNQTAGRSWRFTADPGRFAAPAQLIDDLNMRARITAVAIGDVDGDGRADALFANAFSPEPGGEVALNVRRSLGGGNFAPLERHATAAVDGRVASMTVADLDGNGRHAVVMGVSGVGIQVLRQQGGTLVSSQIVPTSAINVIRVADMNGDGRPDLVGVNVTDGVSVSLQAPDGSFGAATPVPIASSGFSDLAVGDIDGDGRTDIAVITDSQHNGPVAVVLRLFDGSYAPAQFLSLSTLTDRYLTGLAIGDVTGDGRPDLVAARPHDSDSIVLLAQLPAGGFADAVALRGATQAGRVRVADLDADGRQDVLNWSSGGWPIAVNRQRSDGRLGVVETWPVSDYGSGAPDLMALGDLDGDQRPDLIYGGAWLRQRAVVRIEPAAAAAAPDGAVRARAARPGLGVRARGPLLRSVAD